MPSAYDVPRDLFGRPPIRIEITKEVVCNRGAGEEFAMWLLLKGERLLVERVEPDGMGITVRDEGREVSLHVSEYRVLEFAEHYEPPFTPTGVR